MSAEKIEPVVSATTGGVSGDHVLPEPLSLSVAPSVSNEFNTVRPRLIPIACWKIDDIRFKFGSSFIEPDIRDELQDLNSLMKEHPGAPLSIFGHADPVGMDSDNKKLSGRRSKAVYALLTRNTDLWEELYKNPVDSDRWGTDEIQIMLSALGYYQGPINNKKDAETEEAVKMFQRDHNLEDDGDPGSNTRPQMYKAYMDLICVDKEGNPYQLDPKKDFLARGQDSEGKGDYQGCSEFNPKLLFSEEEEKEYSKEANKEKRNAENAPNRRVVIYLFKPGSQVNPEKWPCPRAKEGIGGCKKYFWPDGESRRSERFPAERREYEKTKDTFACLIYSYMSLLSPCEHFLLLNYKIRLFNLLRKPIPNAQYRYVLGTLKQGNADPNGDVNIRALVVQSTLEIEWADAIDEETSSDEQSVQMDDQYPYKMLVYLHIEDKNQEQAVHHRLHNVGFPYKQGDEEGKREAVRSFQLEYKDRGLEPTGDVDEATFNVLKDVHDSAEI